MLRFRFRSESEESHIPLFGNDFNTVDQRQIINVQGRVWSLERLPSASQPAQTRKNESCNPIECLMNHLTSFTQKMSC